ncbi:hypothetical protein ACIRRX_08415 [Streptomyces bacillaris]
MRVGPSDVALSVGLLAVGGLLAPAFRGTWASRAALGFLGIGGGAFAGTRIRERGGR